MKFRSLWIGMASAAAILAAVHSHASAKIVRVDDPGYACTLQYWYPQGGDPNAAMDGNADGLGSSTDTAFFNPGTVVTIGQISLPYAVSVAAGPYTGAPTATWNAFTSPAYCTPGLPLSQIWGNSGADPDQAANLASQGTPALPATGAVMYWWANPAAGANANLVADAEVIVWTLPAGGARLSSGALTLPNGGLELEMDGWCEPNYAGTNPGATASFTWNGNTYSTGTAAAPCSLYSGTPAVGIDLLLNSYGVLVGYVDTSGNVQCLAQATGWCNSAAPVTTVPGGWQGLTVTTTALTLSPTTAVVNSTVTLGAAVTALPGSGPPSGNVVFSAGGTTLGSASLNEAGVATVSFSTATLAAADYGVTAQYMGDASHASSTSPSVTLTVTAAPSMEISQSSNGTTLQPGQSAMDVITLTPMNGFDKTISLSCSGLPAATSCNFAPASVLVNGSATKSTLMIDTTAATAMNGSARGMQLIPGGVLVAGIGLPVLLSGRRRSFLRALQLLGVLALIVSAGALPGCGGGGSSTPSTAMGSAGTPAGTYTITIAAAGGPTTQTVTYTLTVN